MYEDILRYYIYIGGTLLATFGSRTSITPRTPLIHRSASPVPLANTTPAYAVHQKGVWSMVCTPLIYRYLGGFLGFFVSFLVTFRVIFHLWSDLWNDFGTPLEKYSRTCGKRVQNSNLHPFAPICTPAGANGTPHLSVTQRTIVRAFTGHCEPSAYSFGRKYTKLSPKWCPSFAKCHPSRRKFFQNFSLPKIFPPFTLPLETSPYSILY